MTRAPRNCRGVRNTKGKHVLLRKYGQKQLVTEKCESRFFEKYKQSN